MNRAVASAAAGLGLAAAVVWWAWPAGGGPHEALPLQTAWPHQPQRPRPSPAAAEPWRAPAPAAPAVRPATPAPQVLWALDTPATASAGQKLTVGVRVQVAEGASNFVFELHYDPYALRFLGASQGSLMVEANAIARLEVDAQSNPGVLAVRLEQDGGPPVAGSGSLGAFEFQAVAPSRMSTRLVLQPVAVGSLGDAALSPAVPDAAILNIEP